MIDPSPIWSTEVGNNGHASPGRPRDVEVEQRALEAALEIFSRKGWFGFTIGAVAQEARVGKSSIYLRWGSREQLLLAALTEFDPFHLYVRTYEGSVRDQLRRELSGRVRTYVSSVGLSLIRLQAEYQADPEQFGTLWAQTIGKAIRIQNQFFVRAQERGELRPEASADSLAETLEGAALIHAISLPVGDREDALDRLEMWSEDLVSRVVDPWLTERPHVAL